MVLNKKTCIILSFKMICAEQFGDHEHTCIEVYIVCATINVKVAKIFSTL